MDKPREVVRVAALGDIHAGKGGKGSLHPLMEQLAEAADVVALCGDLTDHGLPEEADVLVQELSPLKKIPIVGVLGNHDFESGKQDLVNKTLCDAGIAMLDGEAHVVRGVGFAGIKGFCGGFGRATLSAFGEPDVKDFVKAALKEVMKLEAALARLKALRRIVLMHYSPIQQTVEGEPKEIWAFLGCSRLEEPVNRYQVTAVVHGHAHRGAPEGHTSTGVPVYNVAVPVMRASYPDRPSFRVINVPVEEQREEAVMAGAVETELR
jgi:Icc-related predicted phosphoesterase